MKGFFSIPSILIIVLLIILVQLINRLVVVYTEQMGFNEIMVLTIEIFAITVAIVFLILNLGSKPDKKFVNKKMTTIFGGKPK